jgi:hypothetical protein
MFQLLGIKFKREECRKSLTRHFFSSREIKTALRRVRQHDTTFSGRSSVSMVQQVARGSRDAKLAIEAIVRLTRRPNR